MATLDTTFKDFIDLLKQAMELWKYLQEDPTVQKIDTDISENVGTRSHVVSFGANAQVLGQKANVFVM